MLLDKIKIEKEMTDKIKLVAVAIASLILSACILGEKTDKGSKMYLKTGIYRVTEPNYPEPTYNYFDSTGYFESLEIPDRLRWRLKGEYYLTTDLYCAKVTEVADSITGIFDKDSTECSKARNVTQTKFEFETEVKDRPGKSDTTEWILVSMDKQE